MCFVLANKKSPKMQASARNVQTKVSSLLVRHFVLKQKFLEHDDLPSKKIISNENLVIPKIETFQRKQCCVYIFKCLMDCVCENFKNYFCAMESLYNTRNNSKLIRLTAVKTEIAKKGFFFLGGKCYNDLPPEVRSSDTLMKFKRLLRDHL